MIIMTGMELTYFVAVIETRPKGRIKEDGEMPCGQAIVAMRLGGGGLATDIVKDGLGLGF
jgi:hypothetical protein